MKRKRRPLSQFYSTRPWNKDDAEKALAVETSHTKRMNNESLIIHFSDPELTVDIVKNFHPGIENVQFPVPINSRYCIVQLAKHINCEVAMREVSKIKFGNGHLLAERKISKEVEDLKPEAIDPYTLYIGNLPTNLSVRSVKEKFPTASRIDVGFASKIGSTRYAFIRYTSVDVAIEAFKFAVDLLLESRSLIVRFRRVQGPIGISGESHQKRSKTLEKEAIELKNDTEKIQNTKYNMKETYTEIKLRRHSGSQNNSSKSWNREEAEKALAVEKALIKGIQKESLIIRFPDPEVTKDMVKNFHPGIENVYFQGPINPRYCFVQLAKNINPDVVLKDLSKIQLGIGNLSVEKKFSTENEYLKPETIDPYTLYIGNLPTNVDVDIIKERFTTASRIDVGYTQKMFTRYAFIHYTSVDDAIKAFKHNFNALLDLKALAIKFRRYKPQ